MTNQNNTNLVKLKDLVEDAQNLGVMTNFIVDVETGAAVQYNQIFDQQKVEDLALELLKDIKYTVDAGYDFFESDLDLNKYVLLLVIKYFSHFKDEIGDEFEVKIQAMNALHKKGYYNLFFNEIFDGNQVADVVKHAHETIERALIMKDKIEEAGKEATEKLDKK